VTLLGVVLLVTGAALMVAEAHLPAYGAVGLAGVVAFVAGVAVTVDASGGGLALSLAVAAIAAVAAVGLLLLVARTVARSTPRRVRGGAEGLVGRRGVVRSAPDPVGRVFVDGALWRARPAAFTDDEADLTPGEAVCVESVDGLTLAVRRVEEWELAP
jgi:membrane-bound serine protease (ClpP class)